MADLTNIKNAVNEKRLDYSHYTLARFINQSVDEATEFCLWLIVLVNIEINRGNVCLEVSSIRQKSMDLGWHDLPSAKDLWERLTLSPVVGHVDEEKPLIVDQQKLYFNRYFHNEKRISDALLALSKKHNEISATEIARINEQFAKSEALDYQKLAAIISCRQSLSIISGGPGTGKTWTVSNILLLLLQQQNNLIIKLAAPTGKAAARLSESIQSLQQNLTVDEQFKHQLPSEAVTLHRLLGLHRYTHRARFNQQNPLPCDVLVIDEASMIDQQMMAMLCAALGDNCRLILLGDKDQLSSVEAGSVFADICGGIQSSEFKPEQQQWIQQTWGDELPVSQTDYALSDHVVVLQKSYRFDEQSGIGQIARTINQGESEYCIELLKAAHESSVVSWSQPGEKELPARLKQQAAKTYRAMLTADTIDQAFELFHQYQILCAVWSGPTGVDTVNDLIDHYLNPHQDFYAGKPLMMTSNMYQYDIHNGDIGIIWPDDKSELKIWFEHGEGNYRFLSLPQLPQYKTAYAMTVHKSQGSEFNHILLLLPYSETPVSTRELFYTGITRASTSVEIWGSEDIIEKTIKQKIQRVSGLMERLKK